MLLMPGQTAVGSVEIARDFQPKAEGGGLYVQ